MEFRQPVRIFVGLGYPAEIGSVERAYAVLDDWPPSKRDAAHRIALTACRTALAGEVDAETARATFAAFARRHDILAPATPLASSGDTAHGRSGGLSA